MTDPTQLNDPELEGRLRTLLHERAATVSGAAPVLPQVRLAVSPIGRQQRGRRWLIGAAAACVVAIAAVVTLAVGHDETAPDRVLTTQPSVPPALGSGSEAILFRAEGSPEPEAVARDFLRVRLGDGSDETDAALRDEVDLHAGDPVTHDGSALVPVTWTRRGDHRSTAGATNTIWVRRGSTESEVVGATIDGFDLVHVRYETGELTGEVHAPAASAGSGTKAQATLTRRFAMPLLEPDAVDRIDTDEPAAATVPLGEPFSTPMTASGDLELAVRITDDATGDVVGLAMTALPAPPDPDMEGFEDLTPTEQAQVMEKKVEEAPPSSESPACKEAGAFRMPQPGGFPNEVEAAAAAAVDDLEASGSTPTAAAEALATSLGISWEIRDVELGDLDGGYAIARLPGGRLVDLTVYDDPELGAWRVTEARTRGACRDFGGSNATPLGAANPKTTLGLPVVAGAADGAIWYQTDGVTQRVAVTDHDLSTHWISVAADQEEISGRTTVLRDASGAAVLVDLSPDINVPG